MGGGDATGVSFNGIRSRAWQGKELNPTFLASHASIYACILEYRLCFAWLPSSLSLSLSSARSRGENYRIDRRILRRDNSGGISGARVSFFFKVAVRIIRSGYELHDTGRREEGEKEGEESAVEWKKCG